MSKCIHYTLGRARTKCKEALISHKEEGVGTGSGIVVKCKKWRYDLVDRPLDSRLKLFIFHIPWFKESFVVQYFKLF